jgi:Tfp pilus assembly protein PilO
MATATAKKGGGGGGNDLFGQLARQSTGAKAGILLIVLALIGLVYWQFVYKDLKTKRDSLESAKRGLLGTGTQLKTRWDEIRPLAPGEKLPLDPKTKQPKQRLLDQYQKLNKVAPEMGKALPAEPERNALQSTLQAKAEGSGVGFKSWSHLPEQTVEKYIKVPMAVEVEGSFHKLLDYFRKLGPPPLPAKPPADVPAGAPPEDPDAKREWDRIVTIENLSISPSVVRNDEILLTAKFTASAFRQDEAKAAEPAKPAAGAPAAPAGGAKPPPPAPSLMPGQNAINEEKAKNPHLFEPN